MEFEYVGGLCGIGDNVVYVVVVVVFGDGWGY